MSKYEYSALTHTSELASTTARHCDAPASDAVLSAHGEHVVAPTVAL